MEFVADKPASAVGLIAGNGVFPILFARAARAKGIRVVAIAHRGETQPTIADHVDALTWVRVGQLGRTVRVLRAAGVTDVVFAGGINKGRSLLSLRPDWAALRVLARTRGRGDDALLRAVAAELERRGLRVVPATPYLESVIAPHGHIAGPPPPSRSRRDIALACKVLDALGPHDVGQTVVVERGVVLAVEAVEGTDATIERAAAFSRGEAVVVKLAKRGQDLRFDAPAVGPRTIEVMARSGARVLAVEGRAALVLEGDRVARLAELHQVSVVGCSREGDVSDA